MKTSLRTGRGTAHAPGCSHIIPLHGVFHAAVWIPQLLRSLYFYHGLPMAASPAEATHEAGSPSARAKVLVWVMDRHLQFSSLRKATSKILWLSTGFKTRRPFQRTSYNNMQLNLTQSPLCWGQLFVWSIFPGRCAWFQALVSACEELSVQSYKWGTLCQTISISNPYVLKIKYSTQIE